MSGAFIVGLVVLGISLIALVIAIKISDYIGNG